MPVQTRAQKKAANLPVFHIGLPPAPGIGWEAPFYFPVYRQIANPAPNNDFGGREQDPHRVAELASGKVFAVSDDGNVIGYPNQPVGRWVQGFGNFVGGAVPVRPTYYVGLRRSPRAGTPAPYWTPIYGSSTGEDTSRLACDVFSDKAYRFGENGAVIGYPNQSVGDCVDGFPPAGGRRRSTRRRSTRRRSSRRNQRR
jgi:hypothetical protein